MSGSGGIGRGGGGAGRKRFFFLIPSVSRPETETLEPLQSFLHKQNTCMCIKVLVPCPSLLALVSGIESLSRRLSKGHFSKSYVWKSQYFSDDGALITTFIQNLENIRSQEANLVEEVADSPDFWSGPVQSYNSPVQHRFLIGLDRSNNGLLPDCDRKYVSVRTTPPGVVNIEDIW